MKIKKWCWFYFKKDKSCLGYIYNLYLKPAEYCLKLLNDINGTNYKLKDLIVKFED